MGITSTLSLSFDFNDTKELLKKAAVDLLQTQYGIAASPEDIDVMFKTTMEYDQYDRGPGTPTLIGIEVTVKQAQPRPEAVMPWQHGSCNRR